MATTQRPPRQNQVPPGEYLAKGFEYLTLDPAARLRKARERQDRSDPFREAWIIVGQAIREALRVFGRTIKSSSR
jgi:hypothetical protein